MSAPESATATARRFASIPVSPPDSILGISEAFAADSRGEKMNLSVGVYKDASGATPVMKCVKAAEQKLLENERTKGYLPIDGLPEYRTAVSELLFTGRVEGGRTAIVQVPGGTGGLRVAGEFLNTQCSPTRVFIPNPTWANHAAVMHAAGLEVETYSYLSSDRRSLDIDALLSDLNDKTRPGDTVLLHACCHNPTGVDPGGEQWQEIAQTLAQRGLIPLLDFAYQGFGDGLVEDCIGLHTVLEHCEEAIVCSSFSKNFGLYSERVGAVAVVAATDGAARAALSQLKTTVRCNYSNPPRHGAAIVATVLADPELTRMWKSELEEMRLRITRLRTRFVEGMAGLLDAPDFSFLLKQKGMFSYSGLTPMQVDELKTKHGVYIVGSGRINVAGMDENRMDWLCHAVAEVIAAG